MPNFHYQNLLDDRKALEERFGDVFLEYEFEFGKYGELREKDFEDEVKSFLKSRRLIEWKQEVERLNDIRLKICPIDGTMFHRPCNQACETLQAEIELYREAIALTEAEK